MFRSQNKSSSQYPELKSLLHRFKECDVDTGIIAAQHIAAFINNHKASLPDDKADILFFLRWAVQNYENIDHSGNFHLVDQLLCQLISARVVSSEPNLKEEFFLWYFKNPLSSSLAKTYSDYMGFVFETVSSRNIVSKIEDSDLIGAMRIIYNLHETMQRDAEGWRAISQTIDVLSLLRWACQHLKELERKVINFYCVDNVLFGLLKEEIVAKEVLCIQNAALLKQWCFDGVNPSSLKARVIEFIEKELESRMKDSSFSDSHDEIRRVLVDFLPGFDVRKMKKREALGEGKFANIVRCEVRENNQISQAALKLYKKNQKPINSLRAVFFHHIAQHKNIVTFLGVCTEQRGFFTPSSTYNILGMVLELANYQLYKLMMKKDVLIQDEITRLGFLVDIASALDYLHEQEIVHRNIKPENILIFATQHSLTAKLTDFRFSAYCGEHVPSAGTIGYDPPEYVDAAGERFPCSDKADVYSFGILTHEVIKMQPPWLDLAAIPAAEWLTNARNLRKQHHLENRQPDMNGLSENITSIVTRSLSQNPILRPGMYHVRECIEQERSAKATLSL